MMVRSVWGASVDPRGAVPASAVAVVRSGDIGPEVLLVRRRSGTAFAGAWAFPGGAVDPIDRSGGVSLSAAAVRAAARELGEETSIVAAPGELEPLLGPLVAVDADRCFAVRFFTLWTDRTISVRLNPGELTAHRWLSPADALQRTAAGVLRVPPATRAALATLNRRVGGREGPLG